MKDNPWIFKYWHIVECGDNYHAAIAKVSDMVKWCDKNIEKGYYIPLQFNPRDNTKMYKISVYFYDNESMFKFMLVNS